ncbi:GCC1 protein, partial [Rhinopomastus cyanomelas]|nr:GCC1 protein [Rhinopomastus cyanomelas]
MEKFGMNFGGGPSKKDLLETIESQKKQLLQYQARLKDVVRAYKSLLKEKEALEASLKVLSASHEASVALSAAALPSSDSADDRSSVHSEDSTGTAASADTVASMASTKGELGSEDDKPVANASSLKSEETSGSESSGGSDLPVVPEADKRLLQLKTQLATLTSALSTVTQEKSRMEASYQADKRKMKQELNDAMKKAEDETEKLRAELRSLQEQLAETKARLITQQHDRAQEQGDHAVMLRELQRLLQSERSLRQDTELKLEETREALAGRSCVADRAEGYELHIRQLSQEVEELKRELLAIQEENNKADPRIQDLQEEMNSLRNHFQEQLLQEMKKTTQAEEQLRQHSQMEERRVADLEAQVSQVSELLGTYEKAKQKDQLVIRKLKDRIVQLDLENKTLAIAASSRSPLDLPGEEATLDVNVLKERMERLKKLLQEASGKSPPSAGEEDEELCELELPKGTEAGDGEKATASYYKQELKQLKEEFERYKMRVQVVLKSKAAKDGTAAKELQEAQEQLAELREKYVALQLASDELEKQRQQDREAKKQELSQLQQQHRQELERCRLDCREQVLKLEEELHKQRERALAVLAEKDQELEQLRALALPYGLQGAKSHLAAAARRDESAGDEPSEGLPQLPSSSEPTFILYAEQLARKEVELAALRKQKHKLEVGVHQLQERILLEEEKHREEVAALQSKVEKSCRDRSREGANLEYLKNIVYRFLTLPDALGRQQTLTVILTILHFSPEEKEAVRKQSAQGSWWLSGKR